MRAWVRVRARARVKARARARARARLGGLELVVQVTAPRI